MLKRILVLNGPNLNLLGTREPSIYGGDTLKDVEQLCIEAGRAIGATIDFRQSNIEGELVSWIQDARLTADGIIINPAAYSHTSIAIPDAMKAVGLPVIEVHLTNIHQRESFRHQSYVSYVAQGVICGLGPIGYRLAIDALAGMLNAIDANPREKKQ